MPAAERRQPPPVDDSELTSLFALLPVDGRVVLAVSGGADSVALLGLAHRWRMQRPDGPTLLVATVDHGLRHGSRAEAERVGELAQALCLAHAILIWEGAKPQSGIEEAARQSRYRLLLDHAARCGAKTVVTAHTRDDQAETVLMRLAAGSGPAGLAGMRPREVRDGIALLRPLLGVSKDRLVATLRRDGIGWIEDPSNADPRFARARLRAARDVLAREGLTAERLARLAERMARFEDAIRAAEAAAAARVRAAGSPRLDGHALARLPDEVAIRIMAADIRAVAGGKDAHLSLQRLEALWSGVQAAIRSGRALTRTLGAAVVRVEADGSVLVRRAPPRRLAVPTARAGPDSPRPAAPTYVRSVVLASQAPEPTLPDRIRPAALDAGGGRAAAERKRRGRCRDTG